MARRSFLRVAVLGEVIGILSIAIAAVRTLGFVAVGVVLLVVPVGIARMDRFLSMGGILAVAELAVRTSLSFDGFGNGR